MATDNIYTEMQLALNRITSSIVSLDREWRYTFLNEAALATHPMGREEAMGKIIWDVHPLLSETVFGERFQEVMQTQTPTAFEDYYPPLNIWVNMKVYPSANGLTLYYEDITERKESEKKLKESEERFKALIENTLDIVSHNDEALKPVYLSPSATRITGWTIEDLKKIDGILCIHPEDRENVISVVGKAMENPGKPQPYLIRYQHKEGHYLWLEGTATKLPDDDNVKGLVFNSRDVTKRIELENLLRKANTLARIGSWEVDLLKGTVYWNDITREIHEAESDFVPDLATGLSFYKEGPGRDLISQRVKDTIEEGTPWDEELEIVTAKNNVRWIRTIGEAVFEDGKCVKIYGSFQDIDRRKKAEEKVIESEKLYRNLFTNMLHGFAYCKAIYNEGKLVDYTYLAVNNEYEVLTGLKDITGKNMSEVMPDLLESDPDYVGLMNRVSQKGESVKFETYVAPLNKWFSVSIYCPAEGYFVTLVDNITEQKKAEAGIRLSEKRLLKAQQIGKFGYWQQDLNSDRVWASIEAMRIYGFEAMEGELEREKIASCIIDLEKVKEAAINLLEHDKEYNIEIRINPADGSPMKYISALAELERNEHGKPVRIVGTLQDITERKKAESKLAENENYLRTILNTEPECVKILNSKGELLSMNPAGLAMIEADMEQQVLGHRMTELVDEKYRLGFNRLSREVFNGNSGTFEFEITGLKGSHRWLETHAVPLKDESGNVINLLGVTRDITQRKKAEKEIINTTKQLRQLTAHLQTVREEERKRIAREIHDELGQQLTAIKMDAVWINKQIPTETIAIKEKLQNILGLLDGSNESVRKILNELRPAVLDDDGLIEALQWQGLQFTQTTGTPLQFTTNLSSIKLPPEEATCIFRVYQESLTNIMRYAGARKVISVLNIIDDCIVLTVEDDGRGFDKGMAGNNKQFGLLGMKERVHSLNGQFELITSPGKGTRIVVSLPYKNA